jgi:hypothetical protein
MLDIPIASAEIRAYAVAILLRVKTLGRVIPQYSQRLKVDFVAIAELVEVFGRKVAVDPASNAVASIPSPRSSRPA